MLTHKNTQTGGKVKELEAAQVGGGHRNGKQRPQLVAPAVDGGRTGAPAKLVHGLAHQLERPRRILDAVCKV